MQRWDNSNAEPSGSRANVESVFISPTDLLWNDVASPFAVKTVRAVMCSIDPVYHKVSTNGVYYKLYFLPNNELIDAFSTQRMCEIRGGNLTMTYKPPDFKAKQHIIKSQIGNTDALLWVAGTKAITE
jgi:hypothetical protein